MAGHEYKKNACCATCTRGDLTQSTRRRVVTELDGPARPRRSSAGTGGPAPAAGGQHPLVGLGQFARALLAEEQSRTDRRHREQRAGRCIVAARVRVYSLLRTGLGPTALTGPDSRVS